MFAEPWQAQAFALAVKLSEQGHFTWNEWAAALADELQDAVRRGEPDDGSRYYEHWLAALEKLVAEKGLTDSAALLTRKQAWVSAYRSTPHGQPVELPSSSGISAFLLLLVGGGMVAALYWFMRGEDASALSEGARVGAVVSAGFGALLGMRHALEPDHLAAISTLMTGNRSSAQAAWLGACWGIGHTLTLLVAGGLLMVLKLEMPAVVAQVFELAVIVMLVGFGVRAMHQGVRGEIDAADAHPRNIRTPRVLRHGPLDDRAAIARRRGAWARRQRDADGARGDHAPFDNDASDVLDAVWRRNDCWDGRPVRSARLDDGKGRRRSFRRAHTLGRRGSALNRARLRVGCSGRRGAVLNGAPRRRDAKRHRLGCTARSRTTFLLRGDVARSVLACPP